jgi:hypothetical protein
MRLQEVRRDQYAYEVLGTRHHDGAPTPRTAFTG